MAKNGSISKTAFTSVDKGTVMKKAHIDQLRTALDRLIGYGNNVDNCGNCSFCQTCQKCQTCQSCQSASCQSQSCQRCQSCESQCDCDCSD